MNITDDPYKELIAAIIEKAKEDYNTAKKRGNYREMFLLKMWFLSDWGQTISGNNGEIIIERLEKNSGY